MKEKREFLDYPEDIVDAVARIEEYTQNMEYEDFKGNHLVQDGVIRQIEVVEEAAKRIPFSVKVKYSEIPWTGMAGIRDKMIHGYFGVDLNVVWKIVIEEVPKAKPKIIKILKELKEK